MAGHAGELLAFYDCPCGHSVHLRATNPIESTSAHLDAESPVTATPSSSTHCFPRARESGWRRGAGFRRGRIGRGSRREIVSSRRRFGRTSHGPLACRSRLPSRWIRRASRHAGTSAAHRSTSRHRSHRPCPQRCAGIAAVVYDLGAFGGPAVASVPPAVMAVPDELAALYAVRPHGLLRHGIDDAIPAREDLLEPPTPADPLIDRVRPTLGAVAPTGSRFEVQRVLSPSRQPSCRCQSNSPDPP